MGRLPLFPKDFKGTKDPSPYVKDRSLPAFYMSDFSVMGLLVSDCREAVRILEENNYAVRQAAQGAEVAFDNPAHLQQLLTILKRHHIDFSMADLVDQVYQG